MLQNFFRNFDRLCRAAQSFFIESDTDQNCFVPSMRKPQEEFERIL